MLGLLRSAQDGTDVAVVDAKVVGFLVLALTIGFSAVPMLLRPWNASSTSKAAHVPSGKQRRKKGTEVQDQSSPPSPVEALEPPAEVAAAEGTAGTTTAAPVVSAEADAGASTPPAQAAGVTETAARRTSAAVAELRQLREEAKKLCDEAVFIESMVFHQQRDLAAQVRSISMEAFGEDATQTQRGEKVCVLLVNEEVVGYASYQVRPALGSLNCNKLAVSSHRRRMGLGRCLVRHMIQLAKRPPAKGKGGGSQQQPLQVLCLSALPTAINFYKACGFREEKEVPLPEEEGEELEEGQVYMEYILRRRRK